MAIIAMQIGNALSRIMGPRKWGSSDPACKTPEERRRRTKSVPTTKKEIGCGAQVETVKRRAGQSSNTGNEQRKIIDTYQMVTGKKLPWIDPTQTSWLRKL